MNYETYIKALFNVKDSLDNTTRQEMRCYNLDDFDTFKTDTIVWGNYIFIMNSEISGPIYKDSGYYLFSYKPLNIEIYSKNKEDIEKFFSEEFSMLWRTYANEDDNKLTPGAIILKNSLKELVKEVRTYGDYKN